MMTEKDIRDIAGYMFAPCKYEKTISCYSIEFRVYMYEGLIPRDHKGDYTMSFKGQLMCDTIKTLQLQESKSFKLHLRPLFSLTDEELYTCYEMAFDQTVQEYSTCSSLGILKDEAKFEVYARNPAHDRLFITLLKDGRMYTGLDFSANGTALPPFSAGAVVSYLQSIGVYVPGTIDEKYIDLT